MRVERGARDALSGRRAGRRVSSARPCGSSVRAPHRRLDGVPGPPYELRDAIERALEEGFGVGAIEVGPTRELTTPFDVLVENFGYLKDL